MLRAGEKFARLIASSLDAAKKLGIKGNVALNIFSSIVTGDISIRLPLGISVYENFKKQYGEIVREARVESIKWDREAIPRYQEQLRSGNLTGEERILIRARLLQTASQLAIFETEDKVENVKSYLSNAKEEIQTILNNTNSEAVGLATYLTSSEVTALLSDFNISRFWDEGIEDKTEKAAGAFLTQIEQLGTTLVRASGTFEVVDTQQAENFNNLLADVKKTWRSKNVNAG